MSCAYGVEVEDLLIGALAGADAARVRAHLDGCDRCAEAAVTFEEERSLFSARASALAPPTAAPVPAAVALAAEQSDQDDEIDRRGLFARIVPAFVAAAACIGALAGRGDLDPYKARGEEIACATPPGAVQAVTDALDEPLACAMPASGVVRSALVDEVLACDAPARSGGAQTCGREDHARRSFSSSNEKDEKNEALVSTMHVTSTSSAP